VVMGELGLAEYGTSALVDIVDQRRMAPTENFRKTWYSQAHLYSGPSLKKAFGFKKEGCAICPIQCKKLTTCGKPIPEYETLSHFGALNANPDAESIIRANILCNNLGLDTISAAATIAAYGEARGEFLISDDILDMLRKIAYREGEGDKLAEGSKRYCKSIGKPGLSMSVKGLEMPAYDPRGSYGMALAYGTSNRGACHLRAYTVASEVLGIPVKTDPHVTEGKADLVKAFQDATGVVDSAGICVFTTFAWTLADIQPQIQAACEGDWSMEKLNLVGERIWNMERNYNLAAGLTAKDDDLPPRLKTEAARTGPAKGMVNGIDKMRPEYYKVRGWTPEGVPEGATLERLGL
jgi:aldehyde:ferredoxin oxidoreductase